MKAIYIDPHNRAVRLISIDRSLEAVRREIGAHLVDIVMLGSGVDMFVDDEGLLKNEAQAYFSFNARPQLLAGRAVIVGTDHEGEMTDVPNFVTVPAVYKMITWIANAQEAEEAIKADKIPRPGSSINGETIWKWRGDHDDEST